MSPVPRGGRLALVAALSVFAPAAFAGSAAADVNPDHLSDVPRAQPKVLGRPVPNSGDVYGGQWRQRVPKSLHAALARRAQQEGVSLNMLVTALLAEGLGRRNA